jgi:hypothetical protein
VLLVFLAMVGGAGASVLMSDSFDRANSSVIGSNWTEQGTVTSIENYHLKLGTNVNTGVLWNTTIFNNIQHAYRFTYIDINSSDAGATVGIVFNAQNASNISENSYYIKLYEQVLTSPILYHLNLSGSVQQDTTISGGSSVFMNNSTIVTVVIIDNNVDIYYNNSYRGRLSFPTSPAYTSGYFGFYRTSSNQYVDDATVINDPFCTQTGTILSGNTTIIGNTSWYNCILNVEGNIILNGTSNLTVDKTQLIFNVSYPKQYTINTTDNGFKLQIINGSYLTVSNLTNHSIYLYQINTSQNSGHIELRNSTIENCGAYNTSGNTWLKYDFKCVYGNNLDVTSVIDRMVFKNFTGISQQSTTGGFSTISNNNFSLISNNITQPTIIDIYGIGSGYWTNITNNTFQGDDNRNGMGSFPLFTSTGVTKINISGNHFENFTSAHDYTVDIYGYQGARDYIIEYNYFNDTKKSIVLNVNLSDVQIRNNYYLFTHTIGCEDGCSTGLMGGGNYGISNITIENNTGINLLDYGIKAGGNEDASGKNNNNWSIKNNYIKMGTSTKPAFGGTYQNSIIESNYFEGVGGTGSGIGISLTRLNTDISGRDEDSEYINNTLYNFSHSIKLNGTRNLTFIDTNISYSTNYDVQMLSDNINTIFINTFLNSSKLDINNDSIFNNYYYSDILCQNATSPISGCTITSNTTIITRNGSNITSATTDASGHTPLPIGNDSTTLVLPNMSKNSTVQTDYVNNICAAHVGYTTVCVDKIVNSSNYRAQGSENSYQNTTTITLTAEEETPLPSGNFTLAQINASMNIAGGCVVDFITYMEPETQIEYTYTCADGAGQANATAGVRYGNAFWANSTAVMDIAREW